MNNFIYEVPTKVYFGEGQLGNLGQELNKFGQRVLLCYGGGSIKRIGLYDKVISELKKAGSKVFELGGIDPNPRVSSVRAGAEICKKEKIDVILAVGGGSVIDCAKYIGAAAFYDGDAWDISLGKVDVKKCLPIVTVLTASAAGSEMDTGGVISNPDTNDKIGLLFDPMLPKVSFLDPTNTYTVSAFQTAAGAADILSHIIEVYFYAGDDLYMLDTVMEGLMKTVIKFAPVAIKKPDDYEARANLMWASSWAINGFVSGGKDQAWSCHPMEHELSAFYDITHGLGLAILTPRWMEHVLSDKTVKKFRQFGINVFGIDASLSDMEIAKKSIEMLAEFFFDTCGLERNLSALGITDEHFAVMGKKAVEIGGLKYAYVPLSPVDVEKILKNCL